MAARDEGTWTGRESILWQTCEYVAAMVEGRAPVPPHEILTTFAPQGGPHDRLLAQGPFELLVFRALGDGSYARSGGIFLATGPIGIAATAGWPSRGRPGTADGGVRRRRRRSSAGSSTTPGRSL
ncbi:hypothetical protein [Litorihabitans aurantiacus]|uniref:Uncharacterized protein n=1 Tax=Litorihabitans aurantiacus TaxID=1930061 RepID=A0AA37XDS2_9MICO|nr:hypothetical protein [Litorihabitans aurantiacus]GMA30842.1 hypothetical protein GCM10025875_08340 [Litorihabitans aurantiacus]